jgi:hypothetical protein
MAKHEAANRQDAESGERPTAMMNREQGTENEQCIRQTVFRSLFSVPCSLFIIAVGLRLGSSPLCPMGCGSAKM